MTKIISVEKHFNKVAKDYDHYKSNNSFYYTNLKKLLRHEIRKESTVLEVGCATGDLLSYINPKIGYGMDISPEMVKIAKLKHTGKKQIKFSTVLPKRKFDYIFMSDVIEHLEEPKKTFKELSKLMGNKTKLIITMANPLWEPVLMVAEKMKLKMPEGPHRRIRYKDIKILSEDVGMKMVKHDYKLLIPIKIPFMTNFANKYLEKPLKKFCFIEYFVIVKV